MQKSHSAGGRPNLMMKLTRVATVKGAKNARTSLAFLVPSVGRLRAIYLGR
jgi:hypothetical protein